MASLASVTRRLGVEAGWSWATVCEAQFESLVVDVDDVVPILIEMLKRLSSSTRVCFVVFAVFVLELKGEVIT